MCSDNLELISNLPDISITLAVKTFADNISDSQAKLKRFLQNPSGKAAYLTRTELDMSVIDFMESLKPARYDGHVVFVMAGSAAYWARKCEQQSPGAWDLRTRDRVPIYVERLNHPCTAPP